VVWPALLEGEAGGAESSGRVGILGGSSLQVSWQVKVVHSTGMGHHGSLYVLIRTREKWSSVRGHAPSALSLLPSADTTHPAHFPSSGLAQSFLPHTGACHSSLPSSRMIDDFIVTGTFCSLIVFVSALAAFSSRNLCPGYIWQGAGESCPSGLV
jgi:hypothetical protein